MEEKEIQRLFEGDVVLTEIVTQIPYPIIESTQNVFHDLMSCIIEQQIHYRSTKNTFHKLLENAGLDLLEPHNFSTFEEKALQYMKLSETKYQTIVHVLDFWENKQVDWFQLSDEEVTKSLSSIKGIGQWTIDMILLYTLQRPNVFPCDDFHLKQIMVSLYGLDEKAKLKAQMKTISLKWGKQRSLAVLYLLSWKTWSKENAKKSKNR
jgi:DNA-3-methyladenine glycosylase II